MASGLPWTLKPEQASRGRSLISTIRSKSSSVSVRSTSAISDHAETLPATTITEIFEGVRPQGVLPVFQAQISLKVPFQPVV